MLFVLLAACSGGGAVDYSNGDATAGEALYTANCVSCHGADGLGSDGDPTLVGATLEEPFTNDEDTELAGYILNGIDGTDMPAFDFTDEETADVIAYVHSLF